MSKHWHGCLLALTLIFCGSQLQAQESPGRIEAIMRDMESRAIAAGQSVRFQEAPVVQVAAAMPMPQSVMMQTPAGIPQHLLPEVNSSSRYSVSLPPNVRALSAQDFQAGWTGERFMFSSAYQRKVSPPRGSFSNVPNDCGCCDEWQTFTPCESCCRDLGLNPWVIEPARPNCPPNWWLHPNCSQDCNDCNSGWGQAGPHGYLKSPQW